MAEFLPRMLLHRESGIQRRRGNGRTAVIEETLDCSLVGSVVVAPSRYRSVPYALSYCKKMGQGHLLATSCEEGYVTILDTSKPLPNSMHGNTTIMPQANWQAHPGGIFDVTWAKGDSRILTSAGDQTIGVWDPATAELVATCVGHRGSVKKASVLPSNEDVFATASRDGAVMLWDTREPTTWSARHQTRVLLPVWEIKDAHGIPRSSKTPQRARGTNTPDPIYHASVTAALFIPNTDVLVTAGSGNTLIKFWDLRNTYIPFETLTIGAEAAAAAAAAGTAAGMSPGMPGSTPGCAANGTSRDQRGGMPSSTPGSAAFGAVSSSDRMVASAACRPAGPYGVTCMAASADGSKLLVNCTDSQLYMFNSLSPSAGPQAVFSGHSSPAGNNSYYLRCGFSPDGSHVICASMDSKAYIWKVSEPERAPVTLTGHSGPLCAVAWCRSDPLQVASCADDATVKIWKLEHRLATAEPAGQGVGAAAAAGAWARSEGLAEAAIPWQEPAEAIAAAAARLRQTTLVHTGAAAAAAPITAAIPTPAAAAAAAAQLQNGCQPQVAPAPDRAHEQTPVAPANPSLPERKKDVTPLPINLGLSQVSSSPPEASPSGPKPPPQANPMSGTQQQQQQQPTHAASASVAADIGLPCAMQHASPAAPLLALQPPPAATPADSASTPSTSTSSQPAADLMSPRGLPPLPPIHAPRRLSPASGSWERELPPHPWSPRSTYPPSSPLAAALAMTPRPGIAAVTMVSPLMSALRTGSPRLAQAGRQGGLPLQELHMQGMPRSMSAHKELPTFLASHPSQPSPGWSPSLKGAPAASGVAGGAPAPEEEEEEVDEFDHGDKENIAPAEHVLQAFRLDVGRVGRRGGPVPPQLAAGRAASSSSSGSPPEGSAAAAAWMMPPPAASPRPGVPAAAAAGQQQQQVPAQPATSQQQLPEGGSAATAPNAAAAAAVTSQLVGFAVPGPVAGHGTSPTKRTWSEMAAQLERAAAGQHPTMQAGTSSAAAIDASFTPAPGSTVKRRQLFPPGSCTPQGASDPQGPSSNLGTNPTSRAGLQGMDTSVTPDFHTRMTTPGTGVRAPGLGMPTSAAGASGMGAEHTTPAATSPAACDVQQRAVHLAGPTPVCNAPPATPASAGRQATLGAFQLPTSFSAQLMQALTAGRFQVSTPGGSSPHGHRQQEAESGSQREGQVRHHGSTSAAAAPALSAGLPQEEDRCMADGARVADHHYGGAQQQQGTGSLLAAHSFLDRSESDAAAAGSRAMASAPSLQQAFTAAGGSIRSLVPCTYPDQDSRPESQCASSPAICATGTERRGWISSPSVLPSTGQRRRLKRLRAGGSSPAGEGEMSPADLDKGHAQRRLHGSEAWAAAGEAACVAEGAGACDLEDEGAAVPERGGTCPLNMGLDAVSRVEWEPKPVVGHVNSVLMGRLGRAEARMVTGQGMAEEGRDEEEEDDDEFGPGIRIMRASKQQKQGQQQRPQKQGRTPQVAQQQAEVHPQRKELPVKGKQKTLMHFWRQGQ